MRGQQNITKEVLPSIRQISTNCEGYLLFSELFHCNQMHIKKIYSTLYKLYKTDSCFAMTSDIIFVDMSLRAGKITKIGQSHLKWISFTLQLNHNRSIHAAWAQKELTSYENPNFSNYKMANWGVKGKDLIWSARVPRILARSYFVIYLDVFRGRSTGSCSGFSSPSPKRGSGTSSLLTLSSSTSAPSWQWNPIMCDS